MQKKKIVVVGAGLCGTLLAIRLAQRGHQVHLFEKRADMRQITMSAGRSINLALSDRGLRALRMVGLEEAARELCIPMHGRMIHTLEGETFFSPYSGREDEYINSISRGRLNMLLLDKAEEYANLELHFDSPCRSVDLEKGEATFEHMPSGRIDHVQADHILGADGAGSAVRQSMMRQSATLRFDFSQDWLPHGYKELTFPPAKDGGYRVEKNALHIWPRGTYMLIALPNLDGSFTVTLFLPYEGDNGFHQLTTDERIRQFFNTQFPDAVPHMPELVQDFHDNPTSPLGTIKCYPWMSYDRNLLMGDSAHAIVPFYGQGMNAAFEDVWVLNQFLDQHPDDWVAAFNAYQEHRKPDADAIADLAKDNFFEMRDHVDNPDFIRKRKLETHLEQQYPEYFSKYSMVTFKEDMRYSEAMRRGRAQDAFLLEKVQQQEDWQQLDMRELLRQLEALA